ncbi:SDR family NAD(P)-dependent oxidoreductase [Archangium primigenium]|uniref:SDR family NAD(P)-dependent oxidoreductase n=1 Tax=[Archangium] primigenium TaxID=2792470 RepID=UPI00195C8804|nr:SDR family oxidoreductase [Archangium primigenium]MBM7116447.1 SDR family oxidoreductase [Archangium primigenium]
MRRAYAVVTGASSGIGRELAKVLAREGYALVLVARRTEALRELADALLQAHGTPSVVVGVDLVTPEGVDELVREVRTRGLDVEVLVNSAGSGLAGAFTSLSVEPQLAMIDLNVRVLTALTHAFLPALVTRRRGYVLHLASMAAFQPGPLMAVYYATKAYVLSFSHALHEEMRGTGVHVTALCPGYTETEFAARAAEDSRPRLFQGSFGRSEPRVVAEVGWRAVRRNQAQVVPGLRGVLGTWFMRLLPRPLQVRMARYINTSTGPGVSRA